MAKEVLLWDDPKYMKNRNGNQDLERYLANPALNSRGKFKKLNIKIEDIKQSLFNLNQKNPEYQKELPSGLDNETGFVLKHQLDAFYNGYSDTAPDKVMGIDNIKRLQNATTKETIAKLIKEHDIKGNLNNVKATNEDNIISLSRMGLIELNENGKRLSPKNTKKTVSDNVASAFKSKLENDPTYIASQKAKEKADDKHSEEDAEKKSTLADEIREMNAKIIADTNAYYAAYGKPSTPVYPASTSVNKGGQKEATNMPKKSAANVSANKESNTKKTAGKEQNTKASSSAQGTNKEKNGKKSSNGKNTKSTNAKASKGVSDDKKSQNPAENTQTGNTQQIDGIQNVSQDSNLVNQPQPQVPDAGMQRQNGGATPDLSNTYQDTGASYSGGGSSGSLSDNSSSKQPAKLTHYKGDTKINGANLSLEFELGKWRAEAYANNLKAPAEKLRLENELNQKYSKMDPKTLNYWKNNYENSLKQEKAKPQNTETRQRVDALNLALQKTNEALKNKNIQNVQPMYAPNKVIANPKTFEDFNHNINVRTQELKNYEKEYNINEKKLIAFGEEQQKNNRGFDYRNTKEYKELFNKKEQLRKKIEATKKELTVQRTKSTSLIIEKANEMAAEKTKNIKPVAVTYPGHTH
jgi:hypothetical protein